MRPSWPASFSGSGSRVSFSPNRVTNSGAMRCARFPSPGPPQRQRICTTRCNTTGIRCCGIILLYAGKLIVDSPLILPVFAVGIGFFAVAVFLFFAPFPLWFKGLFIFSALPFYEYSVMAQELRHKHAVAVPHRAPVPSAGLAGVAAGVPPRPAGEYQRAFGRVRARRSAGFGPGTFSWIAGRCSPAEKHSRSAPG